MRPFWRWHVGIFVVVSIATFGLILWHNSLWYAVVPFVVGALLQWHMHYFVHCPKCSRRLRVRFTKERCVLCSRRYLYDCPDCKITWDSQYVEEPSSG